MVEASAKIKQYFEQIEGEVTRSYKVAEAARAKGLDPEDHVSIPLARNMAERVTGLISTLAPQLVGTKMTERIQELEKTYDLLDWRVGFKIAEEVAKENFCKFTDKKEAMEIGIRVGFAYLTLGIVSAPLEGFIGLKIKKRKDGKEYLATCYAGPIRGAGGTAAATSVVLADYIRIKMGYAPYDPSEEELSRYVTEIQDYHERVTNLQYFPSEEEIRFMVSHLAVQVDGDPTEKFEVSNHKDLERIETNRIRGGICLVLAEGLTQKAPKIWKRLAKWGGELDLEEWNFLEEFISLQKKIKAKQSTSGEETEEKIKPNYTFIADLVAGRPVLTHPMRKGGFRLRYGRGRVSGFSAACLNPATLKMLNDYVAIGTQLKLERPGKAATITLCDTIDGPTVKLRNGTVLKVNSESQAKELKNEIEEVLFLGDILFNYGDFSENGHVLVPAGYCEEWWILELEKELVNLFGSYDLVKLSKLIDISEERLEVLFKNYLTEIPSVIEAITLSKKMNVPLHPAHTYYWKGVKKEEFETLVAWLEKGSWKINVEGIQKIILPLNKDYFLGKQILEEIGIPHLVVGTENVVIELNEARALACCFGVKNKEELLMKDFKGLLEGVGEDYKLELFEGISEVKLRDKSGTFIGARMGRPEKAKMRKLTGSPHVLFPVGDEGDRLRSFQAALKNGKITGDFPLYFCDSCKKEMVYRKCEECGGECKQTYFCRFCGNMEKDKCAHGEGYRYKKRGIDINYFFEKTIRRLGMVVYPDLIKGVRGTANKHHVMEHLAKGVLRAKHSVCVNKDGTTRYDCTELPITHFKPKEIHTSIEKLKELGYDKDIKGKDLTDLDQILELLPQDIILPGSDYLEESAIKVLGRVTKFVDELLEKFYGLKGFYNLEKKEDLVGHLVIGLAPHISAGLIGRIIGYSETQGLLAHPMWHAGLRRDCDGDESAVMLLVDALLNFSRSYLPESRGAKTMDSPLVLTAMLYPAEVDDQVHGLDVVWRYPLELYEAALEYKYPWDVNVEQLGSRLKTEKQYEDMGFTHGINNFNHGITCSAYKTLPTMSEKLFGQMEIAQRVRAVDKEDVAKLIIQKHFIKDIKGNLRKFSMQQFRCVGCNEKYKRPPLLGKCLNCGGKLIFTITEGSVVKYLEASLTLARDYDFSPYLKQSLYVVKDQIEGVFGKEKDKQVGLGEFFG
jgi:DNA polymerase II large subunit